VPWRGKNPPHDGRLVEVGDVWTQRDGQNPVRVLSISRRDSPDGRRYWKSVSFHEVSDDKGLRTMDMRDFVQSFTHLKSELERAPELDDGIPF
jgi:hypothetical protein